MREREASARALAHWRRRQGSIFGLGERGSEGRGEREGEIERGIRSQNGEYYDMN